MTNGPGRRIWLGGAALLACWGALVPLAPPTLGQDCTLELEPNETPESAVELGAPGCLTGQLDDAEDIVDHVLWTLDTGEAGQHWSVTLTSLDGQPVSLTLSRITSDPAAPAISTELPIGGLRADAGPGVPAASGDLLLRPGRYVLAISPGAPWTGTPTAYRVDIGPGAPMPPSGDQEPNDDPIQATRVQGAFEASGDAAGTDDYFSWQVADAATSGLWTLEAQAPVGAALALTLIDDDGSVTGDARPEADGVARLSDLRLRAGLRTIRIPGTPDGTVPYILRAFQEDLPFADPEPNDDATRALPIVPETLMAGRLARPGDMDAYRLSVDEAMGSVLLDTRLVVQSGPARRLCLWRSEAGAEGVPEGLRELTCADGPGAATLTGLLLEPGDYLLVVSGEASRLDPYYLRVDQAGAPLAGYEIEPNGTPALATPMSTDETMRGRVGPGDTDHFRVHVEGEPQLWDIEARGPAVRLTWVRADGTLLAAGVDPDGVGERNVLTDGYLIPGDHWFRLDGDGEYEMTFSPLGPPTAGGEIEPNGTPALATPMSTGETMRGRMGPGDTDLFRVHVEGEPQLWGVEARGPSVRLTWVRADGSHLANGVDPDGVGERNVLTDAYLIPGDHWFRLDGDGGYELTLSPLGPPIPGGEREPNDDLALANTLPMDGSITGRIGTAADTDFFRFSLAATEHVLVTLEPPPDATLGLWPQGDTVAIASGGWSPGPGEASIADLVLPAGDHAFTVAGAPTQGRYRLSLSRVDPFELAVDQEPNDSPAQARPVPASLRVEGRLDFPDPGDWYRLDPLLAPGEFTLRTEGVIRSLIIHDGALEMPLTAEADGATYRSPTLPAGASVALGVVAEGPYAITVDPGSTGLVAAPVDQGAELGVELALTSGVSEVAAFDELGQRVEARASLVNRGTQPVALTLDAVTTHPHWSVAFESAGVALEPGASAEVPVTIVVPAQAWADTPVRTTVRARTDQGQATAYAEITPRADVARVQPFRWWSLPDGLLGGLDAAATGLGAVSLVSVDPAAEAALHDGVVPLVGGMDIIAALPLTLTVDLAGDEPVPVAGAILDPTAGPGAVAGTVRGFELLLSEDGVTYDPALSGELSGALAEQSFVLPEPVPARFAQLRITSRFPGADPHLRLGEWKVVATPGWQPAGAPLDIVDPALGGHVAWFDPQPVGQQMLDTILSDPAGLPDLLGYDPQETNAMAWTLGFQNGRAAQVTELGWLDPPGSRPELRFDQIELAGSTAGPLGPWTHIGTWDLERDATGAVSPFALDAPTWLRYIRMSARIPQRASGVLELPGALHVLESVPSDGYRSVVGEWGYGSSAGPFEWQQPVAGDGPAGAVGGEDAGKAETDLPLEAGRPVSGRVARGVDEDWYAFTVPEGQQSVRIGVSGRPTVGVALSLFDAGGAEVPMAVTPGERPGTIDHEAAVTPGSRYRLQVEQPPYSLVVAYDTSGSVGAYIPVMTAALRSYLGGLVPGEETVQLLDFEAPPLLDEFSDDGWLILNSLDAHAGSQSGSSSAEIGLIDAMELLAEREGTRAILVMTDADSSSFDHHTELWRWLALVRPRVFTVHVTGTLYPHLYRRLMQDWAAAGAGYYEHVRSGGTIEHAFDRMATWLRRPADYGLVMGLSAEPPEPPEPGSLRVVSDPTAPVETEDTDSAADGSRSSPAIELVLDTSGSMLEKLGRKRRIDLAKEVLTRLVAERLMPGTSVALRVFRQVPKSCESELAVALGPLDRASLAATIDALGVKRTVKTPLAAAIEAVASDLAAVTGPRVVVILSDGEESCDGDPEAAVRALADQGFDVTVNVVGLGLDKKARRPLARLAEIGGGAYYDARNATGLAEALTGALGAPYVVIDDSGEEVQRGTVDGPSVELQPGTYRVALVGATGALDVVVIESGDQQTLVARG